MSDGHPTADEPLRCGGNASLLILLSSHGSGNCFVPFTPNVAINIESRPNAKRSRARSHGYMVAVSSWLPAHGNRDSQFPAPCSVQLAGHRRRTLEGIRGSGSSKDQTGVAAR